MIDDENQVGAFLPVYVPHQPLKSVIETKLSVLVIDEKESSVSGNPDPLLPLLESSGAVLLVAPVPFLPFLRQEPVLLEESVQDSRLGFSDGVCVDL